MASCEVWKLNRNVKKIFRTIQGILSFPKFWVLLQRSGVLNPRLIARLSFLLRDPRWLLPRVCLMGTIWSSRNPLTTGKWSTASGDRNYSWNSVRSDTHHRNEDHWSGRKVQKVSFSLWIRLPVSKLWNSDRYFYVDRYRKVKHTHVIEIINENQRPVIPSRCRPIYISASRMQYKEYEGCVQHAIQQSK